MSPSMVKQVKCITGLNVHLPCI